MKSLSQHIQETLNNKSMKKAYEKVIEEDLSDLMRTISSKDSGILKGTISNGKQEEK